jgi:hypothetical protein
MKRGDMNFDHGAHKDHRDVLSISNDLLRGLYALCGEEL